MIHESDADHGDHGVPLGSYAAKQCARRVHNDHDLTVARPEWVAPPELQSRFDAGLAFEAEVFAGLESALGDSCLRVDETLGKDGRVDATLAAMAHGIPVILAGQLPNDSAGRRVGKPDILVRWADGSGYVPADVKHHRVTKTAKTRSVRASRLTAPADVIDVAGRSVAASNRFDDYVQLAHYTRMLQAIDRHPGAHALVGAIIGSDHLDDVDPTGLGFVWLQLDQPLFETFSRSEGRRKRSALQRHDHEHGFRLRVADVARRRTGGPSDPDPLVVPIWQPECGVCPWSTSCAEELGSSAASAAFTTGQLDVREWLALRDMGVETTAALADLAHDDPDFTADYVPRVTHQTRPLDRLRSVVQRAQMLRDGVTLERRTTGPLEVPEADVEVDLDIEWDTNDRVYLWGLRVAQGDLVAYHPFVSWEPLTDESERHLAEQMVTALREVIADAQARGRTVRVFHYSTPEPRYLKRVLGDAAVQDLTPLFEDLLPFLRDHFVGVHGLSIKKVAPAVGFHWRDEDPGGLQSQGWLRDARSSADAGTRQAARERLLAYNEDDVAATAAIRAGLREMVDQGLDRL